MWQAIAEWLGSAIVKDLQERGFVNIVTRSSTELNLIDQKATLLIFLKRKNPNMFSLRLQKWAELLQTTNTKPISFTKIS